MKKILLLLFLSVQLIPAFASQNDSAKNYIDGTGRRQGYWIIFGRMQKDKAYANDAKVEEGNYLDNAKTGQWIGYFPNGSKKTEFTFVSNRANGPATFYNEKGIKTEQGNWCGNHWVGPYKMFYDDGTPMQDFNYNTSGQRDGTQTYINPNGTTAAIKNEKNGKEEGWQKTFDANGNLVEETYFTNGVIDPSKTKKYEVKEKVIPPPPPPIIIAPYIKTGTAGDGVYKGEGQHTLMKNGEITYKGFFHNYQLIDGEERIYDNNGLWIETKLYKDGKYVGDAALPTDANK
jgi:antitoxin component YwqK of YwqJK toxin-antitoxin module